MKLRLAWKPLLVQSQIIGLLVLAQFQTSMWTTHAVQRLTLDRMFLYFLLFAGVNFAVVAAANDCAAEGVGGGARPISSSARRRFGGARRGVPPAAMSRPGATGSSC